MNLTYGILIELSRKKKEYIKTLGIVTINQNNANSWTGIKDILLDMDKIPTNSEWGDYQNDLDIASAYEYFAGKSNDDIQSEFKRNILIRCSDIRWMPIIPFQYYMIGLTNYVNSGDYVDFNKADVASCYLELVEEKLLKQPEFVVAIWDKISKTIEEVASNQKKYDADIDIYGDFKVKLRKILQLIEVNKDSHKRE